MNRIAEFCTLPILLSLCLLMQTAGCADTVNIDTANISE